jgi:hypothetical protein
MEPARKEKGRNSRDSTIFMQRDAVSSRALRLVLVRRPKDRLVRLIKSARGYVMTLWERLLVLALLAVN